MDDTERDRSRISQVILRWGYFRDHGMWEELSDTFHPDGEIKVTWYIGRFDGFVAASREMAKRGVASRHVMKPSLIDVEGDRAIAITPVSIVGRARWSTTPTLHGSSIRRHKRGCNIEEDFSR